MLKTLFLGILLCIASTLLIANAALSSPSPQPILFIAQTPPPESQVEEAQPTEPTLPQESNSPETKNASPESETANQQPVNEESPPEKTGDRSQSAGPYDMEAIKAFNRALYGS